VKIEQHISLAASEWGETSGFIVGEKISGSWWQEG
jgi:hypothetical protein